MSARQYLEKEVDPVLKPLLRALVQERPHGATNILQALAKLAAQENKVTVCVTGCTGYVAAEVVRQCLDRGWHVKGTVRDPSDARKTGFLAKLAETLPGTLEFVKADLLEAGSFDAAVEGCTYVFHCASPFFMTGDSDGSEEGEKAAQEKLLKPAVQGTKNVLGAVAKHKANIKCTVVTSSCVAVCSFTDACKPKNGPVFTEDDWNETSTTQKGAYHLSKVTAEKAAWEIAKAEGFKMVTVNPSFVVGPPTSDRNDGTSIEFGLGLLKEKKLGMFGISCVDVRDVGKAHINACLNEQSEGRYICADANGATNWSVWESAGEALKAVIPDIEPVEKPEGDAGPPPGTPGGGFDNSKVQSKDGAGLGIELMDIGKSMADMAAAMKVSHAAHLA